MLSRVKTFTTVSDSLLFASIIRSSSSTIHLFFWIPRKIVDVNYAVLKNHRSRTRMHAVMKRLAYTIAYCEFDRGKYAISSIFCINFVMRLMLVGPTTIMASGALISRSTLFLSMSKSRQLTPLCILFFACFRGLS